MSQEMKDWALKGSRSPRHGAPKILRARAFLLSDDAEWVNGQVWRVNGGVSLRTDGGLVSFLVGGARGLFFVSVFEGVPE